jgi:glucan biosynthesis protein C
MGPGLRRDDSVGEPRYASLALDNLRAFVILLVLSFHSSLAYIAYLPPGPFAFDNAPWLWRSFPIVDPARWFGFDLFCAWQDVFLMSLFFFLSGLFVWPSLGRKGGRVFVHDRMLRLGVPFFLVALLLMPLAHYPTYLQTAADPSVAAYWRHWLALPFWPSGPMWFLWLLLVADLAAAALHRWAPGAGDRLIRLCAMAGQEPIRFFAGFLAVSAVAYVPQALVFGPSQWFQHGPFSFQLSRPLHYALYFFVGLGVGAGGIERGLFAPQGALARYWPAWLAMAALSFVLWMVLTGLTMTGGASPALQVLDDLSLVLACFASCFFVLALFLRFVRRRGHISDSLRGNAYGMYLIHYLFIVWLQFAMLPTAMPAVAKAATVFAGTLLASWALTAAIRHIPPVAHIIGADRRALPRAS